MKRCPKCNQYMTSYFKYFVGAICKLVYSCNCGYSTEQEEIITDNKTTLIESNKIMYTNSSSINYIEVREYED